MADRTLEQEQEAFNAQLDGLLKDHAGAYVVFKDGTVVDFFPTYESAYNAGQKRFGLDHVFLVARVEKRSPHSVSLAWEAGVMFG